MTNHLYQTEARGLWNRFSAETKEGAIAATVAYWTARGHDVRPDDVTIRTISPPTQPDTGDVYCPIDGIAWHDHDRQDLAQCETATLKGVT